MFFPHSSAYTAKPVSPQVTNKQDHFSPLTQNNSLLERNPDYQNTDTKTNGDTNLKKHAINSDPVTDSALGTRLSFLYGPIWEYIPAVSY